MRHVEKGPLIATLKTAELNLVQEVELPATIPQFPDMIELTQNLTGIEKTFQFFRIGITDRRAVYREGVRGFLPD